MPKDVQIHQASRKERNSLRELAHIGRHQLSLPAIPASLKASCRSTNEARSADAAMNTGLEVCFSALTLGTQAGASLSTDALMEDVSHSDAGSNLNSEAGRTEPATQGERLDKSTKGRTHKQAESDVATACRASEPPTAAATHGGTALDQALKANASLRRRIRMLERQEGRFKSQLRLQQRGVAAMENEAAGARRLVLIAEERFTEFENKIETLRDESYRYCRWWLSEYQSLKDLLNFVADPNDPGVSHIASSSRERFMAFYSGEHAGRRTQTL